MNEDDPDNHNADHSRVHNEVPDEIDLTSGREAPQRPLLAARYSESRPWWERCATPPDDSATTNRPVLPPNAADFATHAAAPSLVVIHPPRVKRSGRFRWFLLGLVVAAALAVAAYVLLDIPEAGAVTERADAAVVTVAPALSSD